MAITMFTDIKIAILFTFIFPLFKINVIITPIAMTIRCILNAMYLMFTIQI